MTRCGSKGRRKDLIMTIFKKLFLFLILTSFFIIGCSSDDSKMKVNQLTDDTFNSTQSETTNSKLEDEKNTTENNADANENTPDNSDITQKTKDYILHGQDKKPEAEKIKWTETFLNEVNIDEVYQEYIDTGGTVDMQSFAQYLTFNAPIPDNWQDLVATDLFNTYNKKISHIEHLQDDLYQVYIEIDGSDVPYVVVNSRTGYFHG